MKKLLFVGTAAIALATVNLPALAGTSVGIAIGEPYPVYDHYPNYDPSPSYHPYPDYDDEEDDEDDQISCSEGRQIVRDRGFRQVRPVKCFGSIYKYRALKRGTPWSVRVDSYAGRIVSIRPLGGY
jgi:hypothetical protein